MIRTVHLEPTSHCNAACPLCIRHVIDDDGYALAPSLAQAHLPLETLEQILGNGRLAACDYWLLCGNRGDPMMHPHICEIVRMIKQHGSDNTVELHTNGGLATVDQWRQLAQLLADDRSAVVFSMDGVEHSNHLYRRNVKWQTVMRNATAYMQAGGKAVWKFIRFDHNRDDEGPARRLASEMGFHSFIAHGNASTTEPPIKLAFRPHAAAGARQDPLTLDEAALRSLNDELRVDQPIDCEHLRFDSIYIDADALLWPCCHLAVDHSSSNARIRALFDHVLHEPYGIAWNDLNSRDIDQIMDSRFWADLYRGIREGSGYYKCSRACGKANEQNKAWSATQV